ncbi:MAG: D-hexose-6-phosphate mutarotase [Pirellulaceae bacterium]
MADIKQLEQLNHEFGIDDADTRILFSQGRGDLPKVDLKGPFASAELYLHGAHLTSFRLHDSGELLWMSDMSEFSEDRPIRGGVPICWPWFGKPTATVPQHGFARTSKWKVVETKAHLDPSLEIALRLTDDDSTRSYWPHPFELTLRVIVGRDLTLQLSCLNTGETPITAEAALHTYFHVSDIAAVKLLGLEQRSYLDKLDSLKRKQQEGAITIDREVDRIYVDTDDIVTICDGQTRRIEVRKSGSESTVVWNPWVDKSAAMGDFPNDGYQQMVCVETTNADQDARRIEPGEVHTMTQSCSLVSVST